MIARSAIGCALLLSGLGARFASRSALEIARDAELVAERIAQAAR